MPIQRLQTNQPRTKRTPELQPSEPPSRGLPPVRKSLYWWKISGSLVGVIIVFICLIGYRILAAVNTAGNGNTKVSVFSQLGHIIANRDAQLKGETDDRINILLLGIGGEGHDGPLLTDTIIVASIKPSTRQIALLSVPRDLAVSIPQYGIRKINSANAYGKQLNYPGGGEQLASDIVSKTLNIPIHYYARIDFAGFTEVVDALGGITVNVEHAFSDSEYPTSNYGYQTIRFTAGSQHMTGDTALKFVRSRHGTNGEGSDFARSRRQQLVLEALRDKALSLGTLVNPIKIGNVLSSLGSHTRTNLEVWEMLRLGKIAGNTPKDGMTTNVLDSTSEHPFLKNVTGIDGAYLLEPKDGTFRTVQILANNLFIISTIPQENAKIVIQDASGRAGTAKLVAASLEALGFPSPTINTKTADLTGAITSILDYTNAGKSKSLSMLQDYFGVTAVPSETLSSIQVPPSYHPATNGNGNTNTAVGESPDFVITIGKDFLTKITEATYGSTGTTTTNSNTNRNTNAAANKNTNSHTNTNTGKNTNVNAGTNSNRTNANQNTNTNANIPVNAPLNVNT